METLPAQYSPHEIESRRYEEWERAGCFTPGPQASGEPYIIVIPPPNVTGYLHMGHALNSTIQDILIRWKRMEGYRALWVPGTDHAGIATQNVVEKEILKRGSDRHDLGRDKFIEEVWQWREKHGSRIIVQLKRLGASCDWTRLRFTMDEMLSRAVVSAFVHLYRKGLIYKGKRIIHWCPRCTTALSDEEVEYQDTNGSLYFIRYPLEKGGYIEVATTRPETMLGDTAVAVHPDDERYRDRIGGTVILPFVERKIPVIADAAVEREFGTGAVKVTPSHDPNDFVMGQRHDLPQVTVMDETGRMNENAGPFAGLDRFECREKVLAGLAGKELLSKVEAHQNRVGHCYRCRTVVEPYLSEQWFVKMGPLAQPAIRLAEEGALKFYPERWKKVYLNWLYNIKDWCISRQIWWGHRIPVWYCEHDGCPPVVEEVPPEKCPVCGGKVEQDPDVLDTWFSSWLWPFSVFGWPERTKDLETFYPTDTLSTAQEIIFFWVARMVMAGVEFTGQAPFEHVYIHGTVRDKTGRKMSKSLGNVIDPVEIIEQHGADSLRFSLVSMTSFGQDIFLSPNFYVKGRNFTNKVWNAARFIMMKAEAAGLPGKVVFSDRDERFTVAERWILSRLHRTIEETTANLNAFRFNEALNLLYDFFWHSFCDWYLEVVKLYQDDRDHFASVNLPVLLHVLAQSMKLLHPFIPFVTEEVWRTLSGVHLVDADCLAASRWPVPGGLNDPEAVAEMDKAVEVITMLRDVKTTFRIPLKERLRCYHRGNALSAESRKMILVLGGVADILPWEQIPSQRNLLVRNMTLGGFAVSLEGIINFSEELAKLKKEREKLTGWLEKTAGKLANEGFVRNAAPEVVEAEQGRRTELEEKIVKIGEDIAFLEQGQGG